MPVLEMEGGAVSYRETGAGPTVVLLHSSSSHCGQWTPLMQRLEPAFRCLAPDFLGYGRSDPLPQDGRPCTDHDIALVGAMADLAGEPVHLVGHSLGAAAAARAALLWPERVASVTLFEPVLFALLEETGDPLRGGYRDLAHALMILVHFGADRRAAETFVDFWTGAGAFGRLPEATRVYVTETIARVAEEARALSIYAPGAARLAEFAALAPPVRILFGGATRPEARRLVALLADTIPGAEPVEIDNVGHMGPVTDPDAVNPEIADFLQRRVRRHA
jgi:pimeloyl-ACP methyl ester carboxylesterase